MMHYITLILITFEYIFFYENLNDGHLFNSIERILRRSMHNIKPPHDINLPRKIDYISREQMQFVFGKDLSFSKELCMCDS